MSISIRGPVDHLNPTSTPIASLPHDVLLTVFMLCRPYTSDASEEDLEYGNARCLAFSQVCTGWRALALSTAALWTCIDFAWPSFAEEMLRRAGEAHLDVFWSEPRIGLVLMRRLEAGMDERFTQYRSAALQVALWEAVMQSKGMPASFAEVRSVHHGAHRLLRDPISAITAMGSSIRLFCFEHCDNQTNPADLEALLSRLDCPAPALERLIIRMNSVIESVSDLVGVTASVFAGSAPLLRSLELRTCYVPALWPPYAQLRELSLCYRHERIGLQMLLNILEATPLVDRLRLENAVELDNAKHLPVCGLSTVQLPHLEHFYLEDGCTDDILRHLRFPPLRSAVVSDNKTCLPPNESILDGAGMAQILDATRERILHSYVRLTYSGEWTGSMECLDIQAHAADNENAWLRVAHRWSTFTAFSDGWMRGAPLVELNAIEMEVHDECTTAWPAFFAELGVLEVVTLGGRGATGAVQALVAERLCPRLRCLRLRRAHVRAQVDPPRATLTDVLVGMLRARTAAGIPVASIEMHEMHHGAMATLRRAIFDAGVDVNVVADESWR
jgi:hypothetical protein